MTTAVFWDKIAPKYASQPIADEAAYQRKLAKTREYFRPDSEVLEIGCGTGSTAIAHAPFVKHVDATDFSGKMLGIARERAAEAKVDNVTFRQTSIEALDEPDGSYDVILGLSVLHLLEDREAAIAKIHRLLAPGGVFISSTACLKDMAWYIPLAMPIGRALRVFPFVAVFSGDDLQRGIADTGFELEHVWRPDPKKAMFIVARKK